MGIKGKKRDGIPIPYESSGQRFESSRARQNVQGVAVIAATLFSSDCEVIAKLTIRSVEHIVIGSEIT